MNYNLNNHGFTRKEWVYIEVEKTFIDNCVIVIYKPSVRDIDILKNLKQYGYMEFREDYVNEPEEWTNQTKEFKLSQINDLKENKFIEQDMDAWHITYMLTELGKFYLEKM